MIKEFKEFALKGNMLDLAIGLILGTAFGQIVTSLVNDIIMPPIGLLLGRVDFANLFVNLSDKAFPSLAAARTAGAPAIAYGVFINTVINFLIVAFLVYLLVRQVNRFTRKNEAKNGKAPAPAKAD